MYCLVRTKHLADTKGVHSDNAKSFSVMRHELEAMGIKLTTSSTYSPASYGLAESVNRTLLNKIRALLKEAKLLQLYRGEALQHAVYLHNRTVTSSSDIRPPYKILLMTIPINSSNNKIWLCCIYACSQANCKTRLNNHAEKGCYLCNKNEPHRIQSFKTNLVVETSYTSFEEGCFLLPNSVKCTSS